MKTYGSMTDDGGRTYKTVVIGTQTWMAENLNYNVSGSKCGNGSTLSDANTTTCDTYGRLYDWATAMALDVNCNSSSCASKINAKHRGICPSGWHIPSDAEWTTLTNFVGGSSTAGDKLKATSGWNFLNGQDTYGFSALPGGWAYSSGNFFHIGQSGTWWSSTEAEDSTASGGRRMTHGSYEVGDSDKYGKSGLFSVRCVKD